VCAHPLHVALACYRTMGGGGEEALSWHHCSLADPHHSHWLHFLRVCVVVMVMVMAAVLVVLVCARWNN
jgi:hypothetical protein